MKGFFEHRRERGLEFVLLPGGGMDETKSVGVQAKAAQGVVGRAVFFVTYNGVPEVLGVDTDLVFAACLQVEVHERVFWVTDQHLVMGDGQFTAVVSGA